MPFHIFLWYDHNIESKSVQQSVPSLGVVMCMMSGIVKVLPVCHNLCLATLWPSNPVFLLACFHWPMGLNAILVEGRVVQ